MKPCCTCNNLNQWPMPCLHCDNRGECRCKDLLGPETDPWNVAREEFRKRRMRKK